MTPIFIYFYKYSHIPNQYYRKKIAHNLKNTFLHAVIFKLFHFLVERGRELLIMNYQLAILAKKKKVIRTNNSINERFLKK